VATGPWRGGWKGVAKWNNEMKIFPARPPAVPFGKWAAMHGGYGWLPEGGSMRVDDKVLVVKTAGGEDRYVFDCSANAYRRIEE
jgi:hypothetical protein